MSFTGTLLSRDFLESEFAGLAGSRDVGRSAARLRRPLALTQSRLGPAVNAAGVAQAIEPLLRCLGWTVGPAASTRGGWLMMSLVAPAAGPVGLLAVSCGDPLDTPIRLACSEGVAQGWTWAFLSNGHVLRIVHLLRGVRGILDVDLAVCADEDEARWRLAVVAGAAAFRGVSGGAFIAQLVQASDAHGIQVCRALRGGVREALSTLTGALVDAEGRRRRTLEAPYTDALTAVYRVLFLLFAEARRLVPMWHPIYRAGYSIDALRQRIEQDRPPRGTWATLQAIARLAHAGCHDGDLRVTAFNGRLFAPARAPLLDHLTLDDGPVARSLSALTLIQDGGRRRIAYDDLGVEELGSVYESLLDLEPARLGPGVVGLRQGVSAARKTTGSFYTPRSLTDFVVEATLQPLVADRSPEDILRLRVADPAMGSGAFLVSAGRFLVRAWEHAIIARGVSPDEIDDAERVRVRRTIASRCLFGVDRNPMAVQLAQLSIWLATLAVDRPLSFLDHHLVAGNSLIGCTPADVLRSPRRPRGDDLQPRPLDYLFEFAAALAPALAVRRRLEGDRDDTVAVVREKEAALARLAGEADAARWKQACDLWCTFWLPGAPDARIYAALRDNVLSRGSGVALPQAPRLLDAADRLARRVGCFHWPLEFPEVFLDNTGQPHASGGFDAIVGNPPWEMLRADSRRDTGATVEGASLVRFARDSGVYPAQRHARGHLNECQLFVERALMLVRPGGRVGLIVPATLLTDDGSAALRRSLLGDGGLDSIVVFDNRHGLFPIHRGLRFAALTATPQAAARAVRCQFGVTDPAVLQPGGPEAVESITLSAAVIERISGTGLAIPDLPTGADLSLVEQLVTRHPALSDPAGWNAAFGRELNATDDADCLDAGGQVDGVPVVEGKHLGPYRVDLSAIARRANPAALRTRLGARAAVVDRPRLAYRDVASATNRLTLIAAIVPGGAVTVHTLFCLRTAIPISAQEALCALMNSYVANYLARRWVTTHVTTRIVERLPVPRPPAGDALFESLARGAARARSGRADASDMAALQADAALAYGVSGAQLRHILSTFPLVPQADRDAVLAAFADRTGIRAAAPDFTRSRM